ncbi:hypothetical protein HYW75_05935, partial [Candidatus Pacearchaeota archaeon]|nr:hypothetical protein [Candidatus Pacearchaeota archaeon]
MNQIIELRNKINNMIYHVKLRPFLFKFDPEKVHNFFIKFGKILGSNVFTRYLKYVAFNYQNPIMEQKIFGFR